MRYINFNNFPFGLLRTLAAYIRYEHHDKGSYIYTIGQKPMKFYGIIKGSVSARIRAPYLTKNLYVIEHPYAYYNNSERKERDACTIEQDNIKMNNSFSLKYFVSQIPSNDTSHVVNDNNNDNDSSFYSGSDTHTYDSSSNDYKVFETKYNLEKEVSKFSPGMCFGEDELVKGIHRLNATYCLEDTDLFILDKEYFDEFLKRIISKADEERKNFIRHKIPIFSIDNLNFTRAEFYDKGSIIYTEFQKASDIFIVYQGECALKKLDNAHNEADIYEHKDKLRTVSILDRGGIAGLESSKPVETNADMNYECTLVVTKDFTVLYRMNICKLEKNEDRLRRKDIRKKIKKKDNSEGYENGIRSFFYNIYLQQKEIANKKAINEYNTYNNSTLGSFKKKTRKKIIHIKYNTNAGVVGKDTRHTNNNNNNNDNDNSISHNFEYEQIIPTIMKEKSRNKTHNSYSLNLLKCHTEITQGALSQRQYSTHLKNNDDTQFNIVTDTHSPKRHGAISHRSNNNSEIYRGGTNYHPIHHFTASSPRCPSRNLKLTSYFNSNSSTNKHFHTTTSNMKSTLDNSNIINTHIFEYKHKQIINMKNSLLNKYILKPKTPFIKDRNLRKAIHEINLQKTTNIVNTGYFKMPLLSSKLIPLYK